MISWFSAISQPTVNSRQIYNIAHIEESEGYHHRRESWILTKGE